MMKLALFALALTSGLAHADDELRFPEHGFSISPLKGHSSAVTQQVLTLSMPASGGFAPNVNVQVQPFAETLDAYMKISHEQFKGMGITIVNEKREPKAVIMEYTGTMQGMPLHWYARAIQGPGRIYLVTGTSSQGQWAEAAAEIKKCVDSFKPLAR